MVNALSVFESLKFYCIAHTLTKSDVILSEVL